MNSYGQPYYGNGMMQSPYMYQPTFQNIPQNIQPQMNKIQPMQPTEQQFPRLQGKSVDSIEVVKAMDIPLDGSVSYFPLTDGTAIVTKQLQQDGTSKTIVYKPIEETEPEVLPKYITPQELDEAIKKIDTNGGLKDDIKTIKRQIKDLVADIDELKDRKD